MELPAGTVTLSEESGRLEIRTGRQGMGARAGHDLSIEAGRWHAEAASEGGVPHVSAQVDPSGFVVREGRGGVKPLTDGDRADIKANLERKVLEVDRHQQIAFEGGSWEALAESAETLRGTLSGDLLLHGRREPLRVDVELRRTAGGIQIHASGTVAQSRWGIKPYSALLGTLKVADPVEIVVDATVPLVENGARDGNAADEPEP